MAVEGSLDLFSLPEILQMISQQGKTGILTIQGQQDIVAISFLTGRIVAADSLAHTVEEGLAKLLISEGMLSAADLSRAGAEHQANGGRLLDLLVERRYLTRPQLLGALRLQTVRQLEALLRWQEGDFKFYGGDEVSYEEGFEPISVEDLLLRNLGVFRDPAPAAATGAADRKTASRAAPAPAAQGTAVPAKPPARAAAAASSAAPAAAGAGARVVPGPGATTRVRPSTVQPKADNGERWLPQVPELPDVALPPARQGGTTTPAGGPATPGLGAGGLAAGRPATGVAVGGLAAGRPATGVAAGGLAAGNPAAGGLAAGGLAAAGLSPASGPATAGVPVAERAMGGVPAAGRAATEVPAAGLPAAGLPGGGGLPANQLPTGGLPGAAATAFSAAAASAAVLPAAPAPGPELLPWPAAALEAPPTAPPVRPRPSGAAMVKPPGLPAAAGPSLASAAAALAGSSSPVIVPPARAAVTGRVARVGSQVQGGPAALPGSGQPRPDPSTAAAPRRRPSTVEGRAFPEGTPGKVLPKWFRQMQVERPDRLVPLAHRLLAAGLAVAAAAALAAASRSSPELVLMPFPWEQGERTAYVRNQRESLYDKIEAAAKTAFLRDWRFPDQLSQLRDAGLLSPADLIDPRGEPLLYSAREDSYTLQATEAGKPLADADTSASISGNFFLDPSLLQSGSQNGPPIVLLD
jgi:hypothetical protein